MNDHFLRWLGTHTISDGRSSYQHGAAFSPLDAACPECGADAGQSCQRSTLGRYRYHLARVLRVGLVTSDLRPECQAGNLAARIKRQRAKRARR